MKNAVEKIYPDKRSVLFTFSFRNAGYACIEEDQKIVCMKIKWDLWRGFFCLAEELPQGIVDICNQLIRENERDPEKYQLTGEHYFVSCAGEGRLRIGFAPRRMMSGIGAWLPSVFRLLLALIFSAATFDLFSEICGMWLTYIFPSFAVGKGWSDATILVLIGMGTFFIFFLFGSPRAIPFLYVISWVPVGMIILLGLMKKRFLIALTVPIAIAAVYHMMKWLSSYTGSKRFWSALGNSVFSVALGFAITSLLIGVTPYSTREKYENIPISSELTERYEQACAELRDFQEKSSAEKLDILQAICDYECIAEFGCEAPNVMQGNIRIENAVGAYVDSVKTVTIREDYLATADTEEILNTLLHEIRHYMQYRLVELYRSLEPYIREEYRNMSPFREAASYLDNFNDYHTSEDGYEIYYGQTVEEDSRAWAEERIERYLPFIYGEEKDALNIS